MATQRRFDYPPEFKSLPEYTAHAGQIVTVVRPLKRGTDYDYEGEGMYEVRASDGWTAHAWASELTKIR